MSQLIIKDDYEEAVDVDIPFEDKKKKDEWVFHNNDVAYALEAAGYKIKKHRFSKKKEGRS